MLVHRPGCDSEGLCEVLLGGSSGVLVVPILNRRGEHLLLSRGQRREDVPDLRAIVTEPFDFELDFVGQGIDEPPECFVVPDYCPPDAAVPRVLERHFDDEFGIRPGVQQETREVVRLAAKVDERVRFAGQHELLDRRVGREEVVQSVAVAPNL